MISINGIELQPDMMIDPPIRSHNFIVAATSWSRGGKQIVWQKQRKAINFDLKGGENWGWLTLGKIDELRQIAVIHSEYNLDFHGETLRVRWRFEDQPVLQYTPVMDVRASDETDDMKVKNVVLKFVRILI